MYLRKGKNTFFAVSNHSGKEKMCFLWSRLGRERKKRVFSSLDWVGKEKNTFFRVSTESGKEKTRFFVSRLSRERKKHVFSCLDWVGKEKYNLLLQRDPLKCALMRTAVFFLAVGLLYACRPRETVDSDVVVKVGGQALTRNEVEHFIPDGTPHADSLLMAENYVTKWVKNRLTYEAAKRNIGNGDADIDRLVEEYRRSLLTHRYQANLIRTRLASEIPENEKLAFYREHPKNFTLSNDVIKGLFLIAPVDAPGLEDIRKKYRKNELSVVEEIEKFSIQNAVTYEYFYDRWVDFGEILSKIPVHIPNTSQYLKTKQSIEVSDSLYCYLLNISDYLPAGEVAPYEYVAPQVQELVINRRKIDFLKKTEEELYRDAVRKGQVVFYTNQEPNAE
jgi:hypothetical protein